MLIELYGENFGCFRDRFVLSMVAADIDPDSDRGVVEVKIKGDPEPLRLLRAVALYGPNASGKSTIIRAAGALEHLLRVTGRLTSDSPLLSYDPFALGVKRKEPVTLGIKAVIDGVVYEYLVAYTREAIEHERLIHWQMDEEEVLFERRKQKVSGKWSRNAQFKLITQDFRQNALLLSLADSLAPSLANHIAVEFRNVLSAIGLGMQSLSPPEPNVQSVKFGPVHGAARKAVKDKVFRDWLLARLKSADVGVVDLKEEEVKISGKGPWSELAERAYVGEEFQDASSRASETKGEFAIYRLTLVHGGEAEAVGLPYSRESLGTQRLVEWSPLFYDLTRGGKLRAAFVDELDASMHPVLLREMVHDFNCAPMGNRTQGQLIFTTHETGLMESYDGLPPVLRRDQVYFTRKDNSGAAELYSLAEFKDAARPVHNIRKRYLGGLYGAIPVVDRFLR